MKLSDIGLIGLAVMGQNLVLNMESKDTLFLCITGRLKNQGIYIRCCKGKGKNCSHIYFRGLCFIPGQTQENYDYGKGRPAGRRCNRSTDPPS